MVKNDLNKSWQLWRKQNLSLHAEQTQWIFSTVGLSTGNLCSEHLSDTVLSQLNTLQRSGMVNSGKWIQINVRYMSCTITITKMATRILWKWDRGCYGCDVIISLGSRTLPTMPEAMESPLLAFLSDPYIFTPVSNSYIGNMHSKLVLFSKSICSRNVL